MPGMSGLLSTTPLPHLSRSRFYRRQTDDDDDDDRRQERAMISTELAMKRISYLLEDVPGVVEGRVLYFDANEWPVIAREIESDEYDIMRLIEWHEKFSQQEHEAT